MGDFNHLESGIKPEAEKTLEEVREIMRVALERERRGNGRAHFTSTIWEGDFEPNLLDEDCADIFNQVMVKGIESDSAIYNALTSLINKAIKESETANDKNKTKTLKLFLAFVNNAVSLSFEKRFDMVS